MPTFVKMHQAKKQKKGLDPLLLRATIHLSLSEAHSLM